MTTATDLDNVRERNLRVWTQHTASLEALDVKGALDLWNPNGRFVVAYPISGMPSEAIGHEGIAAVLGGFAAAAESLRQHDVHFHQTADPDVAFVQFAWSAKLKDGSTYDNSYVARVTFRDGRLCEVLEYYGERAHAELIERLTGGSPLERNRAVWEAQSQAFYEGRVEESMAHWHEDARWETVYPVDGLPAVVEGRAALTQTFAGMAALAERIEVRDVSFHQTADPDVLFIEELMVADLRGGGHYENRIAMRVSFRDGKIAAMLEYAGPRETEALLRQAVAAA
jgi:ketosteroid isomerase-like protein